MLLPIAKVIGPVRRKLNRDVLASILNGFRHGHSIPPVEVFYEPETDELVLLDGMHRRALLAIRVVAYASRAAISWRPAESRHERGVQGALRVVSVGAGVEDERLVTCSSIIADNDAGSLSTEDAISHLSDANSKNRRPIMCGPTAK